MTDLYRSAKSKINHRWKCWRVAGVFLGLIALAALLSTGLPGVPFHPDESTLLFMSADFEQLWHDPLSLAWDLEKDGDTRLRYRGIDAPLARYGIGLGRALFGLPAPQVDWDWSSSWEANQSMGSVPTDRILFVGRLPATGLIPLALVFMYLAARRVTSATGALAAALFLGSNALTLLHARRAMAEAPLLFGIAVFLASLGCARRHPWLIGLGAALAFNAKHSALALLPVGLMAVAWLPIGARGSEQVDILPSFAGTNRLRALLAAVSPVCQYLATFVLLTLALNPFLWRDPLGAVDATLSERRDLLERQVSDFESLAPRQVLDTYGERAVVLLAHLYLTPPLFAEIGNYRQATAAAEAAYLANPLHRLWRGPLQGGGLLALTLLGLISVRWEFRNASTVRRRQFWLLLLACGFQFTGLVLAVPLAWQRYSLPLLPFVCLWAGMGVEFVVRAFGERQLLRRH